MPGTWCAYRGCVSKTDMGISCFSFPRDTKRKCRPLKIIKEGDEPREINVREDECQFMDKGEGLITFNMLYLYARICTFHLYFCNDFVGDFGVQFKVKVVQTKKECEEITLPRSEELSCICKSRVFLHCPKSLSIEIPCINHLLWESVMKFIEVYVSNESKLKAWKKYAGTPFMFRVYRFYFEVINPDDNFLPTVLFNDHAEYEIVPNKNYTMTSSVLKISDVTSSKSVMLTLHWSGDSFPESEYLILKNKNELETRFYKLIFPKLEEDSDPRRTLSKNETL